MLLGDIWHVMPDDAAKQPRPCKVKQLLAGDPYFEVGEDRRRPNILYVKLDVARIKATLHC